jgi:hypothetical protein
VRPQVYGSLESFSLRGRRPYLSSSTNSETGIESGGGGSFGTHCGEMNIMVINLNSRKYKSDNWKISLDPRILKESRVGNAQSRDAAALSYGATLATRIRIQSYAFLR